MGIPKYRADSINRVLHILKLKPVNSQTMSELNDCLLRFRHVNASMWNSSSNIILKKHMAFTLMVPGGKADRARTGLNALAESMPFLFEYINYSPKMVERVATIIKPYARFYKGKANNLVYNLCNWQWGILKKKILDSEHLTLPELRDVIMNHVRGFGYKATAHFIRNTGLGMPNEYGGFSSLTLPIIDVHIVKALTGLGFAVPPIAPGVGLNDRDYLALESNFSSLCNLLNIDISLLDAVLWCAYSDNWDMTRSDFDNYQT